MNDTSYNVSREALERVMPLHYTNNERKLIVSKNQPLEEELYYMEALMGFIQQHWII